jgi:beta-lactam-binding protein with PASTA domain
MPESPFAMTVSSNSIKLQGGRGETTVTVTNSSSRPLKARAEIIPGKPEAAAWLTIARNPERVFAPAAVEQFVVQLNAPAGAKEGDYTFQMRVADVSDPNERLTVGPAVGFKIEPTAPPKPPAFPKWIFAVIAVVVLAVGGALYWLLSSPKPNPTSADIVVPDITNKTLADAKTALEGAGLTLGAVKRDVAAKPKDIVLKQTPDPQKTAKKGDAIAVVATDENLVLVPPVTGKSQDQARNLLAGLLEVGSVETNCRAGNDPPNTVYESNPRPNDSVARTTKLLLRVKEDCVPVPRVVGTNKANAFTALNTAGLLGNPVPGSIDNSRIDTVEDQSPAPNELMAKGSTVTLKFYRQQVWNIGVFQPLILQQNQIKTATILRKTP